MTKKNLLLSTCILSLGMFSAPAFAEEAQPAAEQGLGEIVVTAQRREQKLQDVPVAVTAFAQATIAQLRLNDAIQTSKFVPGMISQHNAGLASANAYYLRGLGNSQSTATFDAPVTTYVDDVYVARQNANNYAFFDTERVEVLRGPQGTLFGRNTTGGAINVIMKRPKDHFAATMEVTAGSYDRYTAKASVDMPISTSVLSKLSAFYVSDKGYLRSITTGEKLNGETSWGMRGDLRVLASSNLKLDMSAEFTRNASTYSGMRSVAGASPYVVNGATVPVFYETATGLYKTECTQNNVYTLQLLGKGNCNLSMNTALMFKGAYDLGNGSIEYIAGYRHLNQGYINQYDANTTNPYAAYILVDNGTNDQWSQEVKYNTSLFDNRLHLTAGLFYLQEISNDRQTTFNGGTTAFRAIQDSIYRFKAETAAGYAQGDVKVTDALTVTLGGRFTWEKKTLHFTPSSQFAGLGYSDATVLGYGIPLAQSINKFTPRFAVSYKVDPDVMLFASATNGFKSGGWNGTAAVASSAVTFRPEKTWSYEAGVKSEFFNHKLRVNITGYIARTQDLQATAAVISPVTGVTASLPFNAGTQVVKGVEIETSAKLGDFTLFANPSFMQAKYTYITPATTALTTALSPVRTPTFQFSGGVAYEKAVDALKGTIGANVAWRHNSPYWVAVLNTTHTLTEDYVDMGVTYRTADDKISIGFDVSNLTKQKTITANFLSLFPGDPQRFTARLKLKI
ncbi:TonB-dependent receptor [Novosphingobium sp. FSY-8]|uniref:TonB-dependent receptor n=1 Tax=Novosphingobium ovatum TaxID=1908523 RepID=A0ABW9XBW4_9SPHN|nr:TonB-dependent receptor [Novosphingobium ovatum]NBC36036.1 TonB-dependent receptor [Novosphingobium ovatum]